MKTMKASHSLALAVLFSLNARAADAPSRFIAFAVGNRLTLMVGKYDPPHRWVQSTDFYEPPAPGDSVTLYRMSGKVADVVITEPHRASPDLTFAGWSVLISSWSNRVDPFALALSGKPLAEDQPPVSLPLDDADNERVMAGYLKSKGLHVDVPSLTQAVRVAMDGEGREEIVLAAHSDASALTTEKEAAVYAVALLVWNDHGKDRLLPLETQTSFKPAGRSPEDHERLYGPRDFIRILAAVDIDGDGWKEIAIYRAKEDASQIDLFHFDGHHLRKVLSAYKPNYN